jgi:hypothetical protein
MPGFLVEFWNSAKNVLKSKSFLEKFILLTLGFLVTTGIGNWVAAKFQERSQVYQSELNNAEWNHQHEVGQRDLQTRESLAVFEEISRMMDKRWYRMRKLAWDFEENRDKRQINQDMEKYRKVLYEWNDSLNRNEALVFKYFGEDSRVLFKDEVHRSFKEAGGFLEDYFYEKIDRNPENMKTISDKLGDAERHMYDFNVDMIAKIQDGNIGSFNPGTKK